MNKSGENFHTEGDSSAKVSMSVKGGKSTYLSG